MTRVLHAFADRPIETEEQDWLEIRKYSNALAEYIQNCNTPMTIALQGDWGSGKTSMMNMVRQELEPFRNHDQNAIHTAWFNTWQFSQFHAKDELPINFLLCLVDEIQRIDGTEEQDKQKEKILRIINRLRKNGPGVLLNLLAEHTIPESIYQELKNIFQEDAVDEAKKESVSNIISTLKDELQVWINKKLGDNRDTSRIVIFVDDLDRLEPVKAVELLEILKLFMDLENCVYVLAIDYDVVVRGVKDKYGQDFSEEKGKAFFEKIIQLPFKMPIFNYHMENYVGKLLEIIEIGIDPKGERAGKIYRFIKSTVGTNPRTMKRLFNMLSLLRIVGIENEKGEKRAFTTEESMCLLALLCLQISAEELYNCLFVAVSTLEIEEIKRLLEDSYEVLTEDGDAEKDGENQKYQDIFDECKIDATFWRQNVGLLIDFFQLIGIYDAQGNIKIETYTLLKNVLDTSTMTTNGNAITSIVQKAGEGRGTRRTNLEFQAHAQVFNINKKISRIKQENGGIGLDGCEFLSFTFKDDGEKVAVKSGNDLLQKILTKIYRQDPEKFERMIRETTVTSLQKFFDAAQIQAKGRIKKENGEDILIEMKNSSARKIELIQKILEALNLHEDMISYEVRLKQVKK